MEIIKRLTLSAASLLLLLPILYTMLYLLSNHQLPANDAANYFYTAVNIHHYFQDEGILRGLFHYYAERGWRPIFFPNIAVPFLLASRGDLFIAYWSTALLCLLASMTYVYLYARLMLNRFSAIITTSLICLLPFIQAQILMFYAESALFPCVLGGMYHLIQSDYLRKPWHTVGFVLLTALAIMVRPVEAVTHLFLIFTLFLALGYQQRVFTLRQISQVIFSSLLAVFLFFAVTYLPYLKGNILSVIDNGGVLDIQLATRLNQALAGSALAVLIAAWLVLAFKKKLHAKNYLVMAWITLTIAVLAWFLPFASATFQWIYRTSLGDVAMNTGSLSGSQFSLDVLQIYLQDEGMLAILVPGMLAILSVFMLGQNTCKKILLSAPILYLFLLTPFSLWESFYTVQIVSRKLSITFPAILLALLILGLYQGKWWKLRASIISFLLIVQFGMLCVLLNAQDHQQTNPVIHQLMGNFIPAPSTIHPNPHDVTINFFNEQAKLFHIGSIGLEVLPGTSDARHPIKAEPINPFLLSMMVAADRSPYYANYLYFGTYSSENLQKIRQYDAIFLSDRLLDMQVTPEAAAAYSQKYSDETNSSVKTFYELLYFYSNNKLESIGWRKGPCVVLETQKAGKYLGCLLLR